MQHQRDQRGTCIVARKAPTLGVSRWAANRRWGRLAGSRGPSSPRQGSWPLARPQPMVAPAQRIGPAPALSEGAHSPSWANGRAAAANQPPPHRHAGVRWRPCQYCTGRVLTRLSQGRAWPRPRVGRSPPPPTAARWWWSGPHAPASGRCLSVALWARELSTAELRPPLAARAPPGCP